MSDKKLQDKPLSWLIRGMIELYAMCEKAIRDVERVTPPPIVHVEAVAQREQDTKSSDEELEYWKARAQVLDRECDTLRERLEAKLTDVMRDREWLRDENEKLRTEAALWRERTRVSVGAARSECERLRVQRTGLEKQLAESQVMPTRLRYIGKPAPDKPGQWLVRAEHDGAVIWGVRTVTEDKMFVREVVAGTVPITWVMRLGD